MSNEAIVQAQLDAYNAQDVERFCSFYAADAKLASYNGQVTTRGIEAIRTRHEGLFAQHPKNKATLLNRIAVGECVVDHEDVERAPGGERFQVAAIYALRDGKIARVDFARGQGEHNVEVVKAQIEAYNARDVDRMCAFYSEDCVFADLNGAVRQSGRSAIRSRYAQTFADNPENHAWFPNRIAVGDVVIDHEVGERSAGGERFESIAIYTLKNGLIARCDFAR